MGGGGERDTKSPHPQHPGPRGRVTAPTPSPALRGSALFIPRLARPGSWRGSSRPHALLPGGGPWRGPEHVPGTGGSGVRRGTAVAPPWAESPTRGSSSSSPPSPPRPTAPLPRPSATRRPARWGRSQGPALPPADAHPPPTAPPLPGSAAHGPRGVGGPPEPALRPRAAGAPDVPAPAAPRRGTHGAGGQLTPLPGAGGAPRPRRADPSPVGCRISPLQGGSPGPNGTPPPPGCPAPPEGCPSPAGAGAASRPGRRKAPCPGPTPTPTRGPAEPPPRRSPDPGAAQHGESRRPPRLRDRSGRGGLRGGTCVSPTREPLTKTTRDRFLIAGSACQSGGAREGAGGRGVAGLCSDRLRGVPVRIVSKAELAVATGWACLWVDWRACWSPW